MKFTKPDQKTIERMTVRSLDSLIATLKDQRAKLVEPFDTQIAFYEELREKKRKAQNA